MVYAIHKVKGFIVLVCMAMGLLVFQTQIVAGLTGIDLALRVGPLVGRYSRILEVVAVETRQNLAPAPSLVFDPNQSNKRRVKKGSDPIHNRC
ncbi:hypothetical protein HRI_001350100 [Hibiscus trionum]|uniref:Uncharacterized protein n=1 Tax=Hibiscus trionum TaxID=183268 RepID=A0A9W7HH75_HIBTR|nr:hypothetical protein HRI_001350100 [Hibiscus trionum]